MCSLHLIQTIHRTCFVYTNVPHTGLWGLYLVWLSPSDSTSLVRELLPNDIELQEKPPFRAKVPATPHCNLSFILVLCLGTCSTCISKLILVLLTSYRYRVYEDAIRISTGMPENSRVQVEHSSAPADGGCAQSAVIITLSSSTFVSKALP